MRHGIVSCHEWGTHRTQQHLWTGSQETAQAEAGGCFYPQVHLKRSFNVSPLGMRGTCTSPRPLHPPGTAPLVLPSTPKLLFLWPNIPQKESRVPSAFNCTAILPVSGCGCGFPWHTMVYRGIAEGTRN